MTYRLLATSVLATGLAAGAAQAQVFHTTDGSIQGSLCVGFDCTSSESYGFDTFRLKENNLRIKFEDTSAVRPASPGNDWQLTANASANGGAIQISRSMTFRQAGTPFTVEANARSSIRSMSITMAAGSATRHLNPGQR